MRQLKTRTHTHTHRERERISQIRSSLLNCLFSWDTIDKTLRYRQVGPWVQTDDSRSNVQPQHYVQFLERCLTFAKHINFPIRLEWKKRLSLRLMELGSDDRHLFGMKCWNKHRCLWDVANIFIQGAILYWEKRNLTWSRSAWLVWFWLLLF